MLCRKVQVPVGCLRTREALLRFFRSQISCGLVASAPWGGREGEGATRRRHPNRFETNTRVVLLFFCLVVMLVTLPLSSSTFATSPWSQRSNPNPISPPVLAWQLIVQHCVSTSTTHWHFYCCRRPYDAFDFGKPDFVKIHDTCRDSNPRNLPSLKHRRHHCGFCGK